MRVLVVEPYRKGHTTVVLRYVQKALSLNGIEFVVYDTPSSPEISGVVEFWEECQRRAKENRCDLIHILTIDYMLKPLAKAALFSRLADEKPVVTNLYKYDNLLHAGRALLFRLLLGRGQIRRFFVSSSRIRQWPEARRRGARVHFVPDPYDAAEFPPLGQSAARERLGLAVTGGERVFLVFGTLDRRKGFDLILEAFTSLSHTSGWKLLCAGVLDREDLGSERVTQIEALVAEGRLHLQDGFISEDLVSPLFHAADFVVTAYPRWYEISSGNLTRACAAGRPSICASHGEVGEYVKAKGAGLVFEAESAQALAQAINAGISLSPEEYAEKSRSAQLHSTERELKAYGAAIVAGYEEALELRK